MGFGVSELLILLLIVALLFGTKKLRSMGSDLGSAIKGFRKAVNETEENETTSKGDMSEPEKAGVLIENEAESSDHMPPKT